MAVPPKGWHARVIHPTTGRVLRADPLTEPRIDPSLNSLPRIHVPVPKNGKWQEFDDPVFNVYLDGEQQPIDRLKEARLTEKESILEGLGGLELRTRVQAEFNQKAIHLAAKDLVENNTTYTANVDTPSTTTETNTQIASWSTGAEFRARLARPILDTNPLTVTGGAIESVKTGHTQDEDDNVTTVDTFNGSGDEYNDGDYKTFIADGAHLEFEITFDYDVAAEDVDIRVRDEVTASVDILYKWDGVQIDRNQASSKSLGWSAISDGFYSGGDGYTGNIGEDIQAGETHTLRIEANHAAGQDEYKVDCIAVHDSTYSYTYSNPSAAANGGGILDGPEEYPDGIDVLFTIVPSPKAVTGARVDATVDDTGGSGLNFHLSNDQGENFTSGVTVDTSTTAHFETDSLGAPHGPGVTLKATLGRWGTGGTSIPATGFNGHSLQDATIKADLETMPIVVNQKFDGHLIDTLTELASLGRFLLEFRRDGGTESVEWTKPGQRTAGSSPSTVEFSASRSVEDVFEKVSVYGSSQPIEGEQFEADHGVAVGLGKSRLHEGKERVYDADTDERFVQNIDYTMSYDTGEITTLASGGMTSGSLYRIDYIYQTYGEADTGVANPTELPPQEIPGLTTNSSCGQAARILLEDVENPRWQIDILVPPGVGEFLPIEALPLDQMGLPSGAGPFEVEEPPELTPKGTQFQLGSRPRLEERLTELRQRVQQVARRSG